MPPKTKIKKPQRIDRAKRKIGMPQSGKKRKYSKKKEVPRDDETFNMVMHQSDSGQILTVRDMRIAGEFSTKNGQKIQYRTNPYGKLIRVEHYLKKRITLNQYQQGEAITQLNKILKYPESEKEYEIIARFAYSASEDNVDADEGKVTNDNIETAFKDWIAFEVKGLHREDGTKIDTPAWYIKNLLKLFNRENSPREIYDPLGTEMWKRRKKQITAGVRKAMKENEENITSGEIVKFGTGLEKEAKGEISEAELKAMPEAEIDKQIAIVAEDIKKEKKAIEKLKALIHAKLPAPPIYEPSKKKKKRKANHVSTEPDNAEITETVIPAKKKVKRAIMRAKHVGNKAKTAAYMAKIKAIDKKMETAEKKYNVTVPPHVKAHLSLPAPIPPKPLPKPIPKPSLPTPVPPKPLPRQAITHIYPHPILPPEIKKEYARKSKHVDLKDVTDQLIGMHHFIQRATTAHKIEEKAINKAAAAHTTEQAALSEAKIAHAAEGKALTGIHALKNSLLKDVYTR